MARILPCPLNAGVPMGTPMAGRPGTIPPKPQILREPRPDLCRRGFPILAVRGAQPPPLRGLTGAEWRWASAWRENASQL